MCEVFCAGCGVSLGVSSLARLCRTCRLSRRRARRDKTMIKRGLDFAEALPNWARMVRCVEEVEGFYRPGFEYCLNQVRGDIRAGLVPPAAFRGPL